MIRFFVIKGLDGKYFRSGPAGQRWTTQLEQAQLYSKRGYAQTALTHLQSRSNSYGAREQANAAKIRMVGELELQERT
jgi:hypothetical protein